SSEMDNSRSANSPRRIGQTGRDPEDHPMTRYGNEGRRAGMRSSGHSPQKMAYFMAYFLFFSSMGNEGNEKSITTRARHAATRRPAPGVGRRSFPGKSALHSPLPKVAKSGGILRVSEGEFPHSPISPRRRRSSASAHCRPWTCALY